MKKRNIEFHNKINSIFTSPIPELDKLAEGFHLITQDQIALSLREQELLQALGDKQGLVKEQIKMSTIEYVVGIFTECYQRATGETFVPKEQFDE